ncbi:MAG: carbon-nitrogen hydrolase family protein [Cyclobacteriaceae bacterium]
MKIGIIQHKPVFNSLPASIEKAVGLIQQAAEQSCELVIFGETWFCGYPAWLDYAPEAGLWNNHATKEIFAEMHANSLSVASGEMAQLQKLSKKLNVAIGFGFNEVVHGQPGHGSIYNSFGLIAEGELVIHHRKLMPTFTEKLLYSAGDGAGLVSHSVNNVRVGGLICWEHWMPLSRQALHDTGEQVHLALWPKVHEMHQVASRQYAFEGRCFVIAVGQMLSLSDLPPHLAYKTTEKELLDGGSCVIGPDGHYLLPPVFGKEEILTAELDLKEIKKEQMTLDVSGHYQRPDVFDFNVNKTRR